MPKTTRGKSNVDTRLGEEIEGGSMKLASADVTCRSAVKIISIEGMRTEVNGGHE